LNFLLRFELLILINWLFLLPFPILLFLLYRTGARPALSRRLRYLAFATAVVYGSLLVTIWLPNVFREYGKYEVPSSQLFYGTTVAARVWNWVRIAWPWWLLGPTLNVLAEIAFTFFLVVLFLEPQGAETANEGRNRVVRAAALAAAIIAGLTMFSSVARQIYAGLEFDQLREKAPWYIPATRGRFILFNIRSELSTWCLAIAALIVYIGINRHFKQTKANEISAQVTRGLQ
jgi:hypothetical protein